VLRGPDPERDGVSAWRGDLCAHAEKVYGVRHSARGMSRLLERLGLSRQKTRPRHPQNRVAAPEQDGRQGRLRKSSSGRGSPPSPRLIRTAIARAGRLASAAALARPDANTRTMGLLLEAFAQQIEPNTHAVLVLDQAGWHGAKRLEVPENVTLLHLPPDSPALDPVERVWLYLRGGD
jgi:hypothetical protein